MSFIFNPNADEFVPTAEEEHRHSGERDGYSMWREEAGHCMGNQTPRPRRQKCRDGDGLGRLKPAIENKGTHRAEKQRAYIVVQGKKRTKRLRNGELGPRV
ncbi:MAG: hypothetical protein ABJX82_10180, partial [Paracoccaceae bacterium]